MVERSFDLEKQILGLKWFSKIAVGSFAHGLHSTFNCSVGGENDGRQIRIDPMDLFHEGDTVPVRQHKVKQTEVKRLRFNRGHRIPPRALPRRSITRRLESHLHKLEQVCIIVHYKNLS